MANLLTLPGCRLQFRPITLDDAYTVVRWRNTRSARQSFYSQGVVTPDTHAAFLANKAPHDLVWMVETVESRSPVGMTALKVDSKHCMAEYGRTFIDEALRGMGYATELEYLVLWAAFEWLQLDYLWLDAYTSNQAVIALHNKTGWKDAGVDLFGHTDERGPVLHMVYQRKWWEAQRCVFQDKFKVELAPWQC